MTGRDAVPGLDEVADPEHVLRDVDGRLRPEVDLREDQLPGFVQDLLPRLRAHPGLEVVDEGTPRDYRAARSEPEIRFEAATPATFRDADADTPTDLTAPTDWLDLHVVITVDGHDVPLPALLAAMTLGEPVVILDDGLLVWAGHPALARLAEAVRSAAELRPTRRAGRDGRDERDQDDAADRAVRVGRGDLGLWAELSELGAVDAQASRWVDAARTLAGFSGLPDVDPPGVASDLRSYQRDGFRWLTFLRECGLGGILADDMGLGKTLQSLAAISHARAAGAGRSWSSHRPAWSRNWVLEAARHTPDLVVPSRRRLRGEARHHGGPGGGRRRRPGHLLHAAAPRRRAVRRRGLGRPGPRRGAPGEEPPWQDLRGGALPGRRLPARPDRDAGGEPARRCGRCSPSSRPASTRPAGVHRARRQPGGEARGRRRAGPVPPPRAALPAAPDQGARGRRPAAQAGAGPRGRPRPRPPPALRRPDAARAPEAILGLLDDFDEQPGRDLRRPHPVAPAQPPRWAGRPRRPSTSPRPSSTQLVEHLREVAAEGHRALVFSQFTRFLRLAQQRLVAEGIECVYLDGGTRDRERGRRASSARATPPSS